MLKNSSSINMFARFVLPFVLVMMLTGCSETKLKNATEEIAKMKSAEVLTDESVVWGDAPDFILPKAGGGEFRLSSLKGKVIILNFWATWCPPCREEIPDFISLKEIYADRDLEIVGVSLDKGGERVVKEFSAQKGINYIIVLGNEKVVQKYKGVRSIPTTFIIGREGNIVNKYIGLRTKSVFEEDIKKLLAEKG